MIPMIKNFIKGFIFMFILLMVYLIGVNFILIFAGEGLGLHENVQLFIVISILLNLAPFIFLMITDRIKKKKMLADAEEFLKYGMRANAQVIDIADTGVTINDNPVVRLTLTVNPDTSGTFTHTADLTVSRIKVPRVGDTIRVIYDPKDPSKFSLDQ